MRQRVITLSKRFISIDSYSFSLDDATRQLKEDRWTIKQIVSTSFNHHLGNQAYPVIAVTLLVEKED